MKKLKKLVYDTRSSKMLLSNVIKWKSFSLLRYCRIISERERENEGNFFVPSSFFSSSSLTFFCVQCLKFQMKRDGMPLISYIFGATREGKNSRLNFLSRSPVRHNVAVQKAFKEAFHFAFRTIAI
jgi:hypothetical protein